MPLTFCKAYKVQCNDKTAAAAGQHQQRCIEENVCKDFPDELDRCREENKKLERQAEQHTDIINKLHEERTELIKDHEATKSTLKAEIKKYMTAYEEMKAENESLLKKYALGGKIITKLSGSLQACRKMNNSTLDDISTLTYGFVLPAVTSNGSQTEPMPACAPVSRSESNADTQTTRVKRRNIRVQADVNPRTPVAATKVTVTTQTDGDKEHDEFKKIKNLVEKTLGKFKKNDKDTIRQFNLFDLFQKIEFSGFKSLSFDELSFMHKMIIKYSLRHCLKYNGILETVIKNIPRWHCDCIGFKHNIVHVFAIMELVLRKNDKETS